jgi:hypothetical protein
VATPGGVSFDVARQFRLGLWQQTGGSSRRFLGEREVCAPEFKSFVAAARTNPVRSRTGSLNNTDNRLALLKSVAITAIPSLVDSGANRMFVFPCLSVVGRTGMVHSKKPPCTTCGRALRRAEMPHGARYTYDYDHLASATGGGQCPNSRVLDITDPYWTLPNRTGIRCGRSAISAGRRHEEFA